MWRLLTEKGNPHFSVLGLLVSLQPYSTSSCKKGQRKIESRSKETSLKMMQCREIGLVNYSHDIQTLAVLPPQHFSHHYHHHPSIQEAYRNVSNFMGCGKRSDIKATLGNLTILCVKIFYFPSWKY